MGVLISLALMVGLYLFAYLWEKYDKCKHEAIIDTWQKDSELRKAAKARKGFKVR